MTRILIVDDDPHVVALLSDVLRQAGYEVASVTHSLRAFDRAKEFRPDLLLLDLMMPYLDGIDQLVLFGMDSDLKDIPAIVITAKWRPLEGIEAQITRRIAGLLPKPFDLDALLALVKRAVAAPFDPPVPEPAA